MIVLHSPFTGCLGLLLLVGGRLGLAASSTPEPISATTGPSFLGDDGQWSPVSIRVGSPDQWLYVLPNTLSQETWVVGTGGCDGTSTCEQVRGGVFDAAQSTSFQAAGFYELGASSVLSNYSTPLDYGYYGFDTIALNDNDAVSRQIIAVVNTTDFLIGELGLGVELTRFSGSVNELTLLSSLVQNASLIPSHSYGYTAGASYRLTGVPASLTLGGVDTNRFTPNNVTFSLSSGYVPDVQVNSIALTTGSDSLPSNWNSNPYTLLNDSSAAIFTIDSSTPYLWLPDTVCEGFAQALNLTYNDTLQLYVFPSGNSPDALRSLNLTFTFTLSNPADPSNTVQLTLPYDAFDLQLSYPYPLLGGQYGDPAVDYFPLRKAAASSDYVLGRSFLQETYLTVDYERNNFTLSQAVFTQEAVSNVALYAISRNRDSVFPGPKTSGARFSSGAKAGIGVGAVLLGVSLAAITWLCCFRRRRKMCSNGGTEKGEGRSLASGLMNPSGSKLPPVELLGDKRFPTEAPVDSSSPRFELAGNAPIEMPADDVSPALYQMPDSPREHTMHRNDPRQPAELDHSGPHTKGAEAARSERSASPVPPYSWEGAPQRLSSSISPSSERHGHNFGGPPSSTGQGVSPVGNSSGSGSRRASGNVLSPVWPEAASPNDNGGQAETRRLSGAGRHQGLSGERSEEAPQPSSDSHSAKFSWEE